MVVDDSDYNSGGLCTLCGDCKRGGDVKGNNASGEVL